MRTAYAKKKAGLGLEPSEREARIVYEEHFISLNRLMNLVVKVLLKCGIRFLYLLSLARIYEFLLAIFSSTSCGVRISSKVSATAASIP